MLIQKILLHYEPKKENLLRVIKEINKEMGCFGAKEAAQVARFFGMSEAAVYSAASFYDQIRKEPQNRLLIQICDGANCQTKKGDSIISEVENYFGQRAGDDFNSKVKIERISCIDHCSLGPIMVVNGTVYGHMTPEKVDEVLRGYLE